jgi:hypothetical protein
MPKQWSQSQTGCLLIVDQLPITSVVDNQLHTTHLHVVLIKATIAYYIIFSEDLF